MKKQVKLTCEHCGDSIDPERAVCLELSMTDGKYYINLPEGHESQGGFNFGSSCWKKVAGDYIKNKTY